MAEWQLTLTIVAGILGIIGTSFGILGLTAYINERMKHKANKRNKKEDELEAKKEKEAADLRAMEHEKYKTELSSIIGAALEPLAKDISTIKKDLSKNTEGTVTLLRTDMKKSIDHYKERGYASAGDRANWNELYSTYDRLGGNHFREYVDGWKEELLSLPFQKPAKKRVSRAPVAKRAKSE